MLFGAFLSWWYGRGWLMTLDKVGHRMKVLVEMFSVPILLRTLFSPWKQIVSVSTSDQPLNIKFRAIIDNLISRVVGFFMRLILLMVAAGSLLLASVAGLAWVAAWPLLPLAIPVLLVLSTGIIS